MNSFYIRRYVFSTTGMPDVCGMFQAISPKTLVCAISSIQTTRVFGRLYSHLIQELGMAILLAGT